jgi:hypothetical protein
LTHGDPGDVASMAVHILVTYIDHEDLRLFIVFLFENSQKVSMCFGVMYLLDSAEDPIVSLVFYIVLFCKIAALDEILLEVQVVDFDHGGFSFEFGKLLLCLLHQ